MNKLILFLVAVIFTSCSSYYYTSHPQVYTGVDVVEVPQEEEVIMSQIYPVISFTNWNVYSNYWGNYLYTPYYISPSSAWSFNSPYNYTWSFSYWGFNSWNSGWNNYYGWNSWHNWNTWNHPYNWYGFNSWNHPYNYGWNNWNHPNNLYGWGGCGNSYFFNNTYLTNFQNGGKIWAPNTNSLGTGNFNGGKVVNNSNKYTSVPVLNKSEKTTTNIPTRTVSNNSADRYTSVKTETRTNDIRNYQPTKVDQVRQTSNTPEVRNNDVRSYNSYDRSNDVRKVEPTTPIEKPRTTSYDRNTYQPRTETPRTRSTYTPKQEDRSPQKGSYSSPQRSTPNRTYSSPQRSTPNRTYSSPQRSTYTPPSRSTPPRMSSPPSGIKSR